MGAIVSRMHATGSDSRDCWVTRFTPAAHGDHPSVRGATPPIGAHADSKLSRISRTHAVVGRQMSYGGDGCTRGHCCRQFRLSPSRVPASTTVIAIRTAAPTNGPRPPPGHGPIRPVAAQRSRPLSDMRWPFRAGSAWLPESAAATTPADLTQVFAVSFLRSRHCSR
jgi:hypothetical protein